VAKLAEEMKLKYLVITSVTRDDLPDGGAAHFRDTVLETKKRVPGIEIELLVPDFKGCQQRAIDILSEAMPFVFGHNIETVAELFPAVRSDGGYQRSLCLLKMVKEQYPDIPTKSSMMLGLGENDAQILQTLKDLRASGVDRVALGQYLKSEPQAAEVKEYVTPEKFEFWDTIARDLGFKWVMSSPYTRSSYHAETETGKIEQ
jgi:lipoic acid synthetase